MIAKSTMAATVPPVIQIGTFMEAVLQPSPQGAKTCRWRVHSAKYGTLLGFIAWHNAWRRYAFAPVNHTVIFDSACLSALADFLDQHKDTRVSG